MTKYVAPARGLEAFTCPCCGVYSHQEWATQTPSLDARVNFNSKWPIATSTCVHCHDYALWHNDQMVVPSRGAAPLPSPDMPKEVQRLYAEAASIAVLSPRGAGALLRLGLQVLCKELGASGTNINADIALLVSKGLSPKIQKSLDIVRVTGNEAVHPGQIDTDNAEVVGQLFHLLNLIVESMITVPSRIETLYAGLPATAKEQIEKRDGRKA